MSDKLLTKEIAEKFLMKEDIALHEYTSIEDSAAELLSKQVKDAFFSLEIKELSQTAAESLSKFQGEWLYLDKLENTSDRIYEILSKCQGNLSLGMDELSDEAAKILQEVESQVQRETEIQLPSAPDAPEAIGV